jgi:hypothetical protein
MGCDKSIIGRSVKIRNKDAFLKAKLFGKNIKAA